MQGVLVEPDDGSEVGHSGDFVCDLVFAQDPIESFRTDGNGMVVLTERESYRVSHCGPECTESFLVIGS
jgi:hypothetical protein